MRLLSYSAALVMIISAGLTQGLWGGRWSPPETFAARLAMLRGIPMKIGPWSGRDLPPEEHTYERAGVAGGILRRYEDGRGDAVTVLIVCGKPGPTSVHTPETCYPGAGFEPIASRSVLEVAGRGRGRPGDYFWVVDLGKQDSITPSYLRIFYAWSTGGAWEASANPRLDFAGSAALFKLYVVHASSRVGEARGEGPAASFLEGFLPAISRSLGPS